MLSHVCDHFQSNGLRDSSGRLLQGCGRVFGSAIFTESYPDEPPFPDKLTFDLIVYDYNGEKPDAYQLNVEPMVYLLEDIALNITDGDIITRIRN